MRFDPIALILSIASATVLTLVVITLFAMYDYTFDGTLGAITDAIFFGAWVAAYFIISKFSFDETKAKINEEKN